MAIIGFLAVTVLMAVKNEYLTNEDIYKGIHDDENNVCLCGRPSIRHFCHLFSVEGLPYESFVLHFVMMPVGSRPTSQFALMGCLLCDL